MAVPVWRDPWLWVGAGSYAGDVLTRLGWENVLGDRADRYPRVERAAVAVQEPDLVVLPDEPYPFGPDDGPQDFPGVETLTLPGRWLFWYGPAMVEAPARLRAALGP